MADEAASPVTSYYSSDGFSTNIVIGIVTTWTWTTDSSTVLGSLTVAPPTYPTIPIAGSVPCGFLDSFYFNATGSFVPDPDIGGVGVSSCALFFE